MGNTAPASSNALQNDPSLVTVFPVQAPTMTPTSNTSQVDQSMHALVMQEPNTWCSIQHGFGHASPVRSATSPSVVSR